MTPPLKYFYPDAVGRFVFEEWPGEIDFPDDGPELLIVWPNVILGAN